MQRFTFRFIVGLITFAVGVSAVAAWILFNRPGNQSSPAPVGPSPTIEQPQILSVELQPEVPLRVFNLLVTDHHSFHTLKNVIFSVENRSVKAIRRYSFILEDVEKKGSVSVGTYNVLKPGGTSSGPPDITFTGYAPHVLRVSYVQFSDGTYWRAETGASGGGVRK
jgi:hypothetical protein